MNHKNLDVWNVSMDLATQVYTLSNGFPKGELYGLVSQMRRAVVSIASNIAEGAGRESTKQYIYFLSIAKGSVSELETQTMIAHNIGYLSQTDHDRLLQITLRIKSMLSRQIKSLKIKNL